MSAGKSPTTGNANIMKKYFCSTSQHYWCNIRY
jgi:hypothetical protein